MKSVWFVVVVALSIGLQHQHARAQEATLTLETDGATTPEWLRDLRLVEAELASLTHVPRPIVIRAVTAETALSVADIRAIAHLALTPADLQQALRVLPTPARRDRAYKTLIGDTRWQPAPGFTAEGAMHGGSLPMPMEHK